MGQLWAVLLRMKTAGSAPDEKSFHGVANKRDGCTMGPFLRPKRKFRLKMNFYGEAYDKKLSCRSGSALCC